MNQIKQWIRMDPLDTLFFKGSEPMIAGESHEVRSIFPPMPSTFRGALCTAILQQRGIRFADYVSSGGPDPAIIREYPLLGRPGCPGFEVCGPLFEVQTGSSGPQWLFPAPACWFGDLSKERNDGEAINVAQARELDKEAEQLGLCGSTARPLWVFQPEGREMKSLSGYWTNMAAIGSFKEGRRPIGIHSSLDGTNPEAPALVSLGALFAAEMRTGIALEAGSRRVRTGHLYTTTHVRLRPEVAMVLGLSEPLAPYYLHDRGVLQLGGEQRAVRYEVLSASPTITVGATSYIMALSPFPYDDLSKHGWQSLPRVSGPLIRMGGWDMKEGFHKPMTSYFPSGTGIMVGKDSVAPFGFLRI